MQLYSAIIVNKNTGIPIYTYNRSGENDDDDRQIIFSGIMVTIQKLMEDMNAGKIQNINTDSYEIIGEPNHDIVSFAIGKFGDQEIVRSFLTQLNEIFVDINQSATEQLDPNVGGLIDTMIEQFTLFWTDKQVETGLFAFQQRTGYKPVVEIFDKKTEAFLIGYTSSLTMGIRKTPHSFVVISDDHQIFLGIIYVTETTNKVLVCRFNDGILQDIMANKHWITHEAFIFLQTMSKTYTDLITVDHVELRTKLFEFSNKIEKLYNTYQPDMSFFAVRPLLRVLNMQIPVMIGDLMQGIPLAIDMDEEFAKPIIDMLVYISGMNNVTTTISSHLPGRISRCPSEMVDMYKTMGFSILKPDKGELKRAQKMPIKLFEENWKRILETSTDHLQALFDFKEVCDFIWDKIDMILKDWIEGTSIHESLEKYSINKNETQVIENVLNWINPHISNNVQSISANEVYW